MTPRRAVWWRDPYEGAPYLFRGVDLASGIGCWELVVRVLREEFGRRVNDFGEIRAETPGEMSAAITAQLPAWRGVAWEEGAVVLFREGRLPSHVGIALPQRGFVLHAHADHDVTTFDFTSTSKWKARFVGCFLPV
jgi:cell wall-associated NlpC family hydrolase